MTNRIIVMPVMLFSVLLLACDLHHVPDHSDGGGGGGGGGGTSDVGGAGGWGGSDAGGGEGGGLTLPHPVHTYTWSGNGNYYFDTITYDMTMAGPDALVVQADVRSDDILDVLAEGAGHTEKSRCWLQAYAFAEWPADAMRGVAIDNGDTAFSTDGIPVALRGEYIAKYTGVLWIVVLGKTANTDHFCGLTGDVRMSVVQLRRDK